MAMQHPVSRVAGDELHIARLCDADENRVARTPSGFGLAASFSARNDKLVTMKVDRMVVHSEVDKADTDAFPMPHNQRSGGRTGFSVEGEPVELHIHGVRDVDIRKNGVFL